MESLKSSVTMNNDLISIVIPVYNGSNYLRQAIDSAIGQTYPHTEIIVVNDGSNDNGETRKIAESYGDKIRYLEKENGGVASALNLGIKEMKGSFFSWLSHDDIYYPEKLEVQIDYYTRLNNPKVIVFSHEDTIDEMGRVVEKASPFKFDADHLYYELLYHRFIGGCSLLIPKAAFNDAGLFDVKYRTVQDYDLWYRMAIKEYFFVYLPATTGMSRSHEGQDSKKKSDLLRSEQEDLFIRVQLTLPEDIWIGKFKNKALAYYFLAYQYGLSGLISTRKFDLQQGDKCLSGLSLGKLIAAKSYKCISGLRLFIRQYKKILANRYK